MNALHFQEGRTSFQLDLTGYQFPEVVDQDGDADWLLVNVQVENAGRVWRHTDPALMTFEVQWLAEWLEEVADHASVFASWRHQRLASRIFFTEPNLGFEVLSGHPTGAAVTLRVYLAAEFLPPFVQQLDQAGLDDEPGEVWLDFGVNESELRRAAVQVRSQLWQFPVRLGVSHFRAGNDSQA